MFSMNQTLGEVLAMREIAEAAPYAVKGHDLSATPEYNKTMQQLLDEHYCGDLPRGFRRIFAAVESGDWFYPVYSEQECLEDPEKETVNLFWLPSDDPKASERPFFLIVPGGGFVHVWNMSDGWLLADHFNLSGYNAFVLTYRVNCREQIALKEMEDVSRALDIIKKYEDHFRVSASDYITLGSSAGGYVVNLWSAGTNGWKKYHKPQPRANVSVYGLVSPELEYSYSSAPFLSEWVLGCKQDETREKGFEPQLDAASFPPTAIFVSAGDTVVDPEHSRLLKCSLDAAGIPCLLDIREGGWHGFSGGDGMNMEGWPERMVAWYENLKL